MGKAEVRLKRHYAELSEKETNEVVDVLADLIVGYLKQKGNHERKSDGAEG